MTSLLRTGLIRGLACVAIALGSSCLVACAASSVVAETAVAEPSYLLGPEDVLKVAVWKDEQLTQETVVRPDGMITFPLIGDVSATGRTAEDVRFEIAKRLSKFLPNPNVTVSVLKVLSNRIYVLGRVNKPGEYHRFLCEMFIFPHRHLEDIFRTKQVAGLCDCRFCRETWAVHEKTEACPDHRHVDETANHSSLQNYPHPATSASNVLAASNPSNGVPAATAFFKYTSASTDCPDFVSAAPR